MRKENDTPLVTAICVFNGNYFEITYEENSFCRVLKDICHLSHGQYKPIKTLFPDEEETLFTLFTYPWEKDGTLFCRCGKLFFGMNSEANKILNPVKNKKYRMNVQSLELREISLTSLLQHLLRHINVLEPAFVN